MQPSLNAYATTSIYDPNTGLPKEVDQPQVFKPGVGLVTPKQTFTYTPIGLPLTTQDAEGMVTKYDYDSTYADQVTARTVDFGRLNLITRHEYDAYGDRNGVTDANGNTTTTQFTAMRQRSEVDAPIAGVKTSYTYYPDGPLKTMTRNGATPEVTTFTYTPADQIASVTDPLGSTVTTTYDVDDRAATVTQQISATQTRQRTTIYDALSRPFQTLDTTSGVPGVLLETHTYTLNGRPQSFIDANGHRLTYNYDGLDRPVFTIFPDNSSENYQFDRNGNILQKRARSGSYIYYGYDALNRLTSKRPLGEVAGPVSYDYDLTGRLLQASDQSSPNPYQVSYDTAGRANGYTDQQGRNVTVGHDAVGNRNLLQWPANTNGASPYFVKFQFDAMNRMTEIDPNGSTTVPLARYQWDLLSRLTSSTYGDGTTDNYSQYDAGDNLRALGISFGGGQNNVNFGYTWLDNHQRQSTAVDNSAFQYAPFTGTISYGPANVTNGYTSVNQVPLRYDGNHNLATDGFNTLLHDIENRITQAQNAIHGTTQFLYDPLSHRKQKQSNGVTTQFILAGNEEIADFTGSGVGVPQLLTVRGVGGLPVAQVVPASTGQPESVVYIHHDVHGSTVATSQPGRIGATAYTYSDYGIPGAGDQLNYLFAGYRYDPETRLYYVGARYYSPDLGRFIEPDQMELAAGANFYAYSDNDPVNNTDPSGNFCLPCAGVGFAGGAVVGLASQGLSDYVNNRPFAWQNYAGAALGGGVGGALLFSTANPAAAGAAAAAAQNLTTQVLNIATGQQQSFNPTQFAVQTGVGLVGGWALGATAGTGAFAELSNSYTSLSDQMLTKLDNGIISDMLPFTAAKTFAGAADQWLPGAAFSPSTDLISDTIMKSMK